MKKLLLILLLSFLFFTCRNENKSESGKTFIDEIGNKIQLESNPTRIISAAPNITEIIFSIGADDLLVGRTKFCNYPEKAKKIEVVGDLLHLNFEKVIKLKPNLVFMTVEGNTKETFDKLKDLGIQVYVINPRSIGGILNSIRNISNVLNKKENAQKLISSIETRLKIIYSIRPKRNSAMFVVSLTPLIVAGQNTFINDILKTLNIENISPTSISSYPILSREEILKKNPDWIILPSDYSKEEILRNFPEWSNLNAIRKNRLIYIDTDIFFRPGPRFIDAIEFLAKKITFQN